MSQQTDLGGAVLQSGGAGTPNRSSALPVALVGGQAAGNKPGRLTAWDYVQIDRLLRARRRRARH